MPSWKLPGLPSVPCSHYSFLSGTDPAPAKHSVDDGVAWPVMDVGSLC